ncbi:hypothetical protein QFC24_001764 [Naganishia onofrii]|uniref:Uncharacterized protein n=1 Tax=Naganishia onofrii TaxID=1851511 RepID=A0ACC2XS95_9TREE|nr:hypothetical protein QFC24_001764 [Naganishia onofrii]
MELPLKGLRNWRRISKVESPIVSTLSGRTITCIEASLNSRAHRPQAKPKVNPDGTADYDDTVMMREPGYRGKYYCQKFGAELSDVESRKGEVVVLIDRRKQF